MSKIKGHKKIPLYFVALLLIMSICYSFIASGVTNENMAEVNDDEITITVKDEAADREEETSDEKIVSKQEETESLESGSTNTETNSKSEDEEKSGTKAKDNTTTKPPVTTTKPPVTTTKPDSQKQNLTNTQTENTEPKNTRKVFSGKASYAVTFNTNGGTEIKQQILKDGEKIEKPQNPTRKGFDFAGWFKDEKFTDPVDFESDRIKGNVTVYAKWKSLAGTITHKVIFKGKDAGGGYVSASPQEALGGELIILTVHPDKGKVIKANTLEVDGAKAHELSFRMPEKDVVIYAEFEDAPIIKEADSKVSKKLVATGVFVILLSVSLITVGLVLRQRNGIVGDPEWVDDSIVLSAYGDQKNKQTDDAVNEENLEDKNTEKE
ncbi:MAG TPA: InlB B-repeat-containing protein [Oscillospiraceae bacterium]|nr:InlB B-repeat-containing protein [Oscillospiraceae bacterium]